MKPDQSGVVAAGAVISRLCDQMGYSRPHVAKILRANAKEIGARRVGGRWMMGREGERLLRRMVKTKSGPRYKLGETGSNRS